MTAGPRDDIERGRTVAVAVAALGAAALVTQLVLLRELTSLLGGDERTLGAGLGAWLLLGGAGAAAGARLARAPRATRALGPLLLALAPLPLAAVVAARLLVDRALLPGVAPAPLPLVAAVTLWLAPFASGQGAALGLASAALARPGRNAAGDIYLADTLGALIAGGLYAGWLVTSTPHAVAAAAAGALLALGAAGIGLATRRRAVAAAGLATALGLVAVAAPTDLDRATLAARYPGAALREVTYSAHGRLLVLERAGRRELVRDGAWLAASDDPAHAELAAHLPLAARPAARRVLLIGGSAAGTAREALRFGAEAVDVLEPDPALPAVVARWFPEALGDPRITVHAGDARGALEALGRAPGGARYDVVIVDLPPPSTLTQNRYYSVEFVAHAARVLAPGGLFAVAVGRYENHVGPRLSALLSIERTTLATVFGEVRLLPVGDVWFLASEAPLEGDLAARIAGARLGETALAPSELAAALAPERVATVVAAARAPARPNRDLEPRLVGAVAAQGAARFPVVVAAIPLGLALLLAAALFQSGALGAAVSAAGFLGGALQVLLLLGYALLRGDLFRELAVLVTVSFAGMALGLRVAGRTDAAPPRAALPGVLALLALLAAALPWGLARIAPHAASAPAALVTAFLATALFGGALVGAALPLAARTRVAGALPAPGSLFAVDFLGGAVGAALVGAWLVPALGVATTARAVAAVALAGAIAAGVAGRRG